MCHSKCDRQWLVDEKLRMLLRSPERCLHTVSRGKKYQLRLFISHKSELSGLISQRIFIQIFLPECGMGPPLVSGASLTYSPTTPAPYLQGTEFEYKCDCGKNLKDNTSAVNLKAKCTGQLDWMPIPECFESEYL